MFKEAFPENYKAYRSASKRGEVKIGQMFVTETGRMYGPRWIINFPTKQHWRSPSQMEWIREGLTDLEHVVRNRNIRSIALPPLGAGNGGLLWSEVRAVIECALYKLSGEVDITVYEPTVTYQNVRKGSGVEALTPARAIIAEVIRRYWVLGIECSILEVQKLAWFVENSARDLRLAAPLRLNFEANRYGPYSDGLRHLLNGLDGSYLHSTRRINDASPFDIIRFDDSKREILDLYIASSEAKIYESVLDSTARMIDGFESPLGMELLATVDWLHRSGVELSLAAMTDAIRRWPGGEGAAERKLRIFDRRLIELALKRVADRRHVVVER